MSKLTLTGLALPLFLLFASPPASAPKAFGATKETPESQAQAGTLQKMIVENGSVTMDLDVNQLNGIGSAPGRPTTLQFAVAANSFFPILVFNELLRGPEPGSMALIPQPAGQRRRLQFTCGAARVAQAARNPKTSVGRSFDLAVRDGKTGFTFFNIDGGQYDYDANAQSLSITGGRLLVSKEFAKSLGRASQLGAVAGQHLDWRNDATRRDHTARRKRRCEIRETASTEPTRRRDCPGPGCHHRRADRPRAIGPVVQ